MFRNQRHEDRYDIKVEASAHGHAGNPQPISLTNLSRNGCRFVADPVLRFGTSITIAAGRAEPLSARILWRFGRAHGVRFDRPLSQPVFDHFRLFLSAQPALVAEREPGTSAG